MATQVAPVIVTMLCYVKTNSITSKDHMKILGVVIDQKLSWEYHIAAIKRKASNVIRHIARTRHILLLRSRKLLSEALVTPHYNYCFVIYDGCSKKAKIDLQRNQNYAAKALLGRRKFSSVSNARRELKWLPLRTRRRLHTGVFIHKVINGKSSKHGLTMVEGFKPHHNHNTRQFERGQLNCMTHNTKQVEKAIFYRATKVWNEITSSTEETGKRQFDEK